MSSLLNLETFKELISSWTLLIILGLLATILWLCPDAWLTDPEVAAFRNTHRGYLGMAAITLDLLLVLRVALNATHRGYHLVASIPARLQQRRNTVASREKLLRKLDKLDGPSRELLLECFRLRRQRFRLPSNDKRAFSLHKLGVISCTDYDHDECEFAIHLWLWKERDRILTWATQRTTEKGQG